MADVTVEQLAHVVGAPVERLLSQMKDAGLTQKSPDAIVSDEDKLSLLDHLKRIHGDRTGGADKVAEEARQFILSKKTQQAVKVSDNTGKKKIVNVEVRKKRTHSKNNDQQNKQKKANQAPKKMGRDKKPASHNKAKPKTGSTTVEVSAPPVNKDPVFIADEDKGRRNSKRRHAKSDRFSDGPDRSKKNKKERLHDAPSARKTFKSKALEQSFTKPTAPVVREVSIPETITVGELAQRMAVKAADVVKYMFNLGTMVTINQVIDQDTASIVVEDMGHKVKLSKSDAIEESLTTNKKSTAEYDEIVRPPVVTVMGHVDHGKTSLLDFIRSSRVQMGEAGGITQHIGAYNVETSKGRITFLDTPGHQAFTAMRARGAQATDLVVLVVAADDGVKPQTEEAVQHAKAAKVPIIVAINKMDKPDADPDRVKNGLSHHEVISEDWGGDVQFIPLSAHTGEGVDDLLDAILLQAEILELKAPARGASKGIVIESRLDKGRGPVASILVQSGLLKKGDNVLVGQQYGRVRAMYNENGKHISEAGPSIPVEVLGLDGAPESGDEVIVVQDERKAREIALFRQGKYRDVKLAKQQAAKLENMFKDMDNTEKRLLKVVLKTDVRGSLEAITSSLAELGNDEVSVQVISGGVGGITESDANLAVASDAIIFGFNVRADSAARRITESEGLELRYYNIIYDVINDIKQALTGMLNSEFKEEIVGIAEVRDVFRAPKIGAIAGCMVIEGTMFRNESIRVLRENVVIFEGELESLRRYPDDVSEVKNGMECGIGVKNYNDVKVGDKIEVYKKIQVKRTL